MFENAVMVAVFNMIIVILTVALPFATGRAVAAGTLQFHSATGLAPELATWLEVSPAVSSVVIRSHDAP
eukprot:scaffold500862_cov14-Prasinocladus_malaysianus.AAC.1